MGSSLSSQRQTIGWCNDFYRAVHCTTLFPYASAHLERKPQTSRADNVFLCVILLYNTYVWRKSDFIWVHVCMVFRSYTITVVSIQIWKDSYFSYIQCFYDILPRVQGQLLAHFSLLVSSHCVCGSSFMVLSPVRGHCAHMMCLLAQTEYFHQTTVVVESRMKRKAEKERGNTSVAQMNRRWV